MELADLVINYRDLIQHFNRREYAAYFADYKAQCESVFDTLDDPEKAAEEMLAALEADWAKNIKKLKISYARDSDKMVICMFFNPMAMAAPSPNGKIVAEKLCELYGEKYPKEKYQVGTYEIFMEGFKPTFLGLHIK